MASWGKGVCEAETDGGRRMIGYRRGNDASGPEASATRSDEEWVENPAGPSLL